MMRLYFIICVTICALFLAMPVHALTVAPAITEVSLDPGSSIERDVTVFNETNKPITISARVETFIPRGEHGAVTVVDDASQAIRWVQLGQTLVTIAPGTAQTVPVLITVPKTASVGGYYLAIMWQQSTLDASGVTFNSRVGSLLLLTVKGEVQRSLAIKDVSIVDSGFANPLRIAVTLDNTGNIHVKPHGLVVIKNIFNRVVATVPINSAEGNVLPRSTRVFEVVWPNQSLSLTDMFRRLVLVRAGIYVEVEYDGGTALLSDEQKIWTVPPMLSIGVLILMMLFGCFVVWLVRKNKKSHV